ncbi:MAG: hypothetical protein U0236_09595 [Nitrospira sp.]
MDEAGTSPAWTTAFAVHILIVNTSERQLFPSRRSYAMAPSGRVCLCGGTGEDGGGEA